MPDQPKRRSGGWRPDGRPKLPEGWYYLDEVPRRLGLTTATLRTYCTKGKLKCFIKRRVLRTPAGPRVRAWRVITEVDIADYLLSTLERPRRRFGLRIPKTKPVREIRFITEGEEGKLA